MAQSCSFPPSSPTVMVVLLAFIIYPATFYYRWKGMACEAVVPNKPGHQMDPGYTAPMPQSDFSLQAYGRLTQLPENQPHCCLLMRVVAHTTWLPSHTWHQMATYISSTTPPLTPADRLTTPRYKWSAPHL